MGEHLVRRMLAELLTTQPKTQVSSKRKRRRRPDFDPHLQRAFGQALRQLQLGR